MADDRKTMCDRCGAPLTPENPYTACPACRNDAGKKRTHCVVCGARLRYHNTSPYCAPCKSRRKRQKRAEA